MGSCWILELRLGASLGERFGASFPSSSSSLFEGKSMITLLLSFLCKLMLWFCSKLSFVGIDVFMMMGSLAKHIGWPLET
jgi:hypothetical protein